MHLQSAEYWGQKATRAKHTADQLAGANAKAVMLEISQHYETLAHHARIIATMLDGEPATPTPD